MFNIEIRPAIEGHKDGADRRHYDQGESTTLKLFAFSPPKMPDVWSTPGISRESVL
jgi:hypothetical protein